MEIWIDVSINDIHGLPASVSGHARRRQCRRIALAATAAAMKPCLTNANDAKATDTQAEMHVGLLSCTTNYDILQAD